MTEQKQTKDYFVTIRYGKQTGFLLGPYKTHIEAIYNVQRGKRLALHSSDCRAHFSAYGTASLPAGILNTSIFGI
jgi:hypothetical protein